MTQRQLDAPHPIPRCKLGHLPRYMLDMRQASAGGGHFILCQCGATRRHVVFDFALRDWLRLHSIRRQRAQEVSAQRAILWPGSAQSGLPLFGSSDFAGNAK